MVNSLLGRCSYKLYRPDLLPLSMTTLMGLYSNSQRGDVQMYLVEFKHLANRIVGLPPQFLLSCFVSGL